MPPKEEKAIEWILLTNQPVRTFDEACERVRWYTLRWRIEMYFKVLKSGFPVEKCRLGAAEADILSHSNEYSGLAAVYDYIDC